MTVTVERKTGEDINVNITLTIDGVPDISVFSQILVTFYYSQRRAAVGFSHHATVPSAVDLVDEAAAEGKTIRTITLNGNTLEMVIPVEDTDDLALAACDEVLVLAEITYIDAGGKKRKTTGPDDPVTADDRACDVTVFRLIKSTVEGLI